MCAHPARLSPCQQLLGSRWLCVDLPFTFQFEVSAPGALPHTYYLTKWVSLPCSSVPSQCCADWLQLLVGLAAFLGWRWKRSIAMSATCGSLTFQSKPNCAAWCHGETLHVFFVPCIWARFGLSPCQMITQRGLPVVLWAQWICLNALGEMNSCMTSVVPWL